MSIYQKYCTEITDERGDLKKLTLAYPGDFNFGYDVVDVLAEETPDKKALVWCNTENEEHIFTFSDIKKYSNQMAHEYWFAAVALHKIGAVMIPATHMLTVSDLVYRIKASKVKAIICTPQNEVPEKIQSALEKAKMTAKLWCVQQDVDGFENLSNLPASKRWLPIRCSCTLPPEPPAIPKGSSTTIPIPWRIS